MWTIAYMRGQIERPPRKSSDSKKFPYADLRVPVILIKGETSEILIANSTADKLHLLRSRYEDGDVLLGAWPGRQRQDIFIIDTPDLIRYEQALHRALTQ